MEQASTFHFLSTTKFHARFELRLKNSRGTKTGIETGEDGQEMGTHEKREPGCENEGMQTLNGQFQL